MSSKQRVFAASSKQPHTLLWWAIGSIVMVFVVYGGRESMAVNAWSLRFLRHQQDPAQVPLPAPPSAHAEAVRWQIEDALMAGAPVNAAQLHALPPADKFVQRDLGHLAWAGGDGPTALTYWRRIGDYNSVAQLAAQAEAAGDLETAYQAQRTAYAIDPIRAAGGLATFLARHDSADEAIRVLLDARTLTDNDTFQAVWLSQLGRIYADNAQWTAAELAYRELAQVPGRAAAGAIEQAWLLYRRGDGVDAALMRMGEAVQAAPKDARPYYETARLLAQAQRYNDADVWYRAAMQHDPDNPRYALAFAQNARSAGELTQAEARLQTALTRHGADAALWAELAELYRQLAQPEAAVGALTQAIAVSSEPNAGYHRRLAALYTELGDATAAQAEEEIALAIEGRGRP